MRLLTVLALLLPLEAVMVDPAEIVRCKEVAFSLSAETRDLELFASFLDPDARFAGSSVQRGPAAIKNAWSAFFEADGPAIKWRPEFVEVLEDGDLALTRGPWLIISTDENGERSESWGTFNSVWRLRDNVWRVVFDAGNVASPPLPDATRALLEAEHHCEIRQAHQGKSERTHPCREALQCGSTKPLAGSQP